MSLNILVDDYTHAFTAVKLLNSPSVAVFSSKSLYPSWSLDFYYAVDTDPQVDIQAITISGFLNVVFMYQTSTQKYRLSITDGVHNSGSAFNPIPTASMSLKFSN